MIACIIEFGVKSGKEAQHQAVLGRLMAQMHKVDGFLSKETFDSRNNPGKTITISYWRDEDSLKGWNADPDHISAMVLGTKELFTHYWIQISEVSRERKWEAPN